MEGNLALEVLTAIKAATVFLKVDAGLFKGTGTGFVFHTEGTTTYIATNEHVAVPPTIGGAVYQRGGRGTPTG